METAMSISAEATSNETARHAGNRLLSGEFNGTYAGIGAKGYDIVAYFTQGKAVPGSDRYTHDYGGVTWYFASAAHCDLFRADPAKYAPQYGGFCSWGVGEKGRLFDVDPANGWTVHEGKLYLNFNADINKTFRSDPAGYVDKANANWPRLSA
jgi:YHS domain-containing protein